MSTHDQTHMQARTVGTGLPAKFAVAALALAIAACSPGLIDDIDGVDMCTPPEGGVDQLAPIVQRTKPFAPRALTTNLATPWSSSRSLAVTADAVYVADADNGTVAVLDPTSLEVLRTVPVGARPEHIVVGPDGRAFVSVRHAGTIAVLHPGANVIADSVEVGVEPTGMALSPDGKRLFVALAGTNELVVVHADTLAVVERNATGTKPRAVTVANQPGKAGKLIVTVAHLHGDARVFTYDLASDHALQLSDAPLRAANPAQLEQAAIVKQARWRALAGAIQPESGSTLIAHVLVSPGNADSMVAIAMQGDAPEPNVSGGKSKSGGGSSSSDGYGASGPTCMPGTPIRPIEVAVSSTSKEKGSVTHEFAIEDPQTGRNFLANFDQPHDIIHHPSVSLAFVAAFGTDNVLVLNTGVLDPMRFPLAEIKVGMAPRALGISADGKRLLIHNAHGFSVSEFDLAPLLATVVDAYPSDGAMPPQLLDAPMHFKAQRELPFAQDPMPTELRAGRRVFTFAPNDKVSAAGRFACASCHLEGDEDKQVWFITNGPRQTPALAGRLAGTAPFNWEGSETQLHDNMGKTIERMGGKGLSSKELTSLEQFMVHGLVPPPNPNVAASGLTEQQERGRQIFYSAEAACSTCHSGEATTDGALWDVGTATSAELTAAEMEAMFKGGKPRKVVFNTPSLRGLHHTAPYLHDGSAATLEEVLTRTAGKMGKVAHLNAGQRKDLIAFLKTL